MEPEEEGAEPRNQDPAFIWTAISTSVGFVEQYGWFLLIAVVVAAFLYKKFERQIGKWQSDREAMSYKKKDSGEVRERMEAMERARQKMQNQLDAQAKEFTEKQQKKEAEKREERIKDWEQHQQGKGYRNKTKTPAEDSGSKPSSSSGKPSDPKKKLKPEYNPLMGDFSGASCRYRPSPRGGAMGGG